MCREKERMARLPPDTVKVRQHWPRRWLEWIEDSTGEVGREYIVDRERGQERDRETSYHHKSKSYVHIDR